MVGIFKTALGVLVTCAAAALACIAAVAPAAAAGGTVYVAPGGSSGAAGTSCATATYAHIADAVAAAASGGTVVVCPGSYAEDVLVTKPLHLVGQGATIDATGLENAIQVVSSDVSVRGFDLVNANGEGLLVGIDSFADIGLLPPTGPVLTNVSIDHVRALNNDKGFNGTEQGNCKYPGDCGGGIHLNVVEHSSVTNSQVSDNADGILLTDDYGPNAYNLIQGNLVSENHSECGIVLPSHSSDAVSFDPSTFAVTGRNPSLGGVYSNRVIHNIAVDNGTDPAPPEFGGVGGSGSGIGIFGSGPGSAAYNNFIAFNYMAGNGLAGLSIHAHHPGGEDMNGNTIFANTFGTNNLLGDPFDGGVSDFETTAIAIYSVPPATMAIAGNVIRDNAIGLWLTNTISPGRPGITGNIFVNVGTQVSVNPAQ